MRTTAPYTSEREFQHWLPEALPRQGRWSESDYLWLTDQTKRLIEYTDGNIDLLPWPTCHHQGVVQNLFFALHTFVEPLGTVHFAGLRVRIRKGKLRAPDIILVKHAKDVRRQNRFWTGADLISEVVSDDEPTRDLIDKRRDYAEGRILEYWIVNPQDETITVLKLVRRAYVERGIFYRGDIATSVILPGFSVSVDAVFDAK